MGHAIADYWNKGKAGRLRVFSPNFDEDEMPVEDLFRSFDAMPAIEQEALHKAFGRILGVGAGAGCHTMALQKMGKNVTAIDVSPLSVATMSQRGVRNACLQDFWEVNECYDTILMLMNGIGIVGHLSKLPDFFHHIDHVLAVNGQLLLDSSDISYIFEDEDGNAEFPETLEGYYGELEYVMQYKRVKSNPFSWLYIDPDSLIREAKKAGFKCEIMLKGDHYDYLARITRTEQAT